MGSFGVTELLKYSRYSSTAEWLSPHPSHSLTSSRKRKCKKRKRRWDGSKHGSRGHLPVWARVNDRMMGRKKHTLPPCPRQGDPTWWIFTDAKHKRQTTLEAHSHVWIADPRLWSIGRATPAGPPRSNLSARKCIPMKHLTDPRAVPFPKLYIGWCKQT